MITIEDPVQLIVPHTVAARLAEVCTLDMDGHRRSQVNVNTARRSEHTAVLHRFAIALSTTTGRAGDGDG